MRPLAAFGFFCLLCSPAFAADEESFHVYSDHPRLFLTQQRLRLLRRERQRQSMRWEQLNRLVSGGAAMPQPAFSWALDYEVTQDRSAAAKAIAAASAPKTDLRSLALVFDWCQDALTPAQRTQFETRLRNALATPPPSSDLPAWRDRILAAVAIGTEDSDLAAKVLRDAVTQWWRGHYAPALGTDTETPVGGALYPLVEILHAIRDNLTIDLRQDRPAWFDNLAAFHIASHYPAPYPAAENEYRIPMYPGGREPDLDAAALSRAAGLSLVAFDNNATSSQYLQGWLIMDRYMLRGPFGAPYEFLWANPYQPGLSYMHLPLVFHDPKAGTLFVRGSWEDDSPWFGLLHGRAQLFTNGAITALETGPGAPPAVYDLGSATIVRATLPIHATTNYANVFVIGLRPSSDYLIEPDGEEMREALTDAGGTLDVRFPRPRHTRILIHESPFPTEPSEDIAHDTR